MTQVLVSVHSLRRSDQVWLDWLCGRPRISPTVLDRPHQVALASAEMQHNRALWLASAQINVNSALNIIFGARIDFFTIHIDEQSLTMLHTLTAFGAACLAAIYALPASQWLLATDITSWLSTVVYGLFATLLTLLAALATSVLYETNAASHDSDPASFHRLMPSDVNERLIDALMQCPSYRMHGTIAQMRVALSITQPSWPTVERLRVAFGALGALVVCVHATLLHYLVANVLRHRLAWSSMHASLFVHLLLYDALPWLAMLGQRPSLVFDVPWRRWLCRLAMAGFFGRLLLERQSDWWFPLAVWFQIGEPALGAADLQWRLFSGDQ
jgi:hypothetical protein